MGKIVPILRVYAKSLLLKLHFLSGNLTPSVKDDVAGRLCSNLFNMTVQEEEYGV